MANSLHEQLLKAGLVDKKTIQKAKKNKHQQKVNKKGPTEAELAQQRARQQREEKAERDRQLNQQRNQQAEQRAIASQIRQLVEMNRLSSHEGDIAYNFTHARKIKRLYVTEELLNQLSRGQLAIVTLDEHYHLVPAAVAEKIKLRDDSVVVLINQAQPEDDADDPYADYKIPDDLMW